MFAGFKLQTENEFYMYKAAGQNLFNNHKKLVEEEINKFMLGDGSIDGTKMQSNWFPQIDADIFVSHSHKDEDKAIALAGWLHQTFGLNAFVDSCVWGYSENLLKKIDDTYCINPEGSTYDYQKRNYSTSHVHIMLSTALSMMLDKTECTIFLNTPNSVKSSEVINQTESPWIYYELGMTSLIRKKDREAHREKKILKKAFLMESAKALKIKYDVNLEQLVSLSYTDLKSWESNFRKDASTYSLDHLYKIKDLVGR